MFTVELAIATRAADELALPLWLPMLPSYQFPTIEWTPGRVETVERVTFPDAPDAIQIRLRGELDDADRTAYLDLGWRVREAPPPLVRPSSDGLDDQKDGSGV